MKKVKQLAIIGAGNGGITAAIDFKQRGFSVALSDIPVFTEIIDKLKIIGTLTLKEPNKEDFKGKIDLLTNDISEAIYGADIVILSIPGEHTESFAEYLVPHLQNNQCVLFMAAGAMCAQRFLNKAKIMGFSKKLALCEFNTLPYATRAFPNVGEVDLSLRVKELYFAALPASNNDELYQLVSQIYPGVKKINDVWEILLNNGNIDVHAAPALLSAGRIERAKGEFWLYREAITEHTYNVMIEIDKERQALGKALGYDLEPMLEPRIRRGYIIPEKYKPTYQLYNESPVFSRIKGPSDLTSRYFTEEASGPISLMIEIGQILGVKTPVCSAIVTLASALLQKDLKSEGLSLSKIVK